MYGVFVLLCVILAVGIYIVHYYLGRYKCKCKWGDNLKGEDEEGKSVDSKKGMKKRKDSKR